MSIVQPKTIESQNPFYITNNSAYGTAWQSANNESFGALNNDDIPLYKQVVSNIKNPSQLTIMHAGRARVSFKEQLEDFQTLGAARDA